MISTLKFLADSLRFIAEKPYEMFGYPGIPIDQRSNCSYETFDNIVLLDVRDSREEFSLEEQGFKFFQHLSKCHLKAEYFESPGNEPNAVVDEYLDETMAMIREKLGASKTICFDWRFRRSGFSLDEQVQRTDARRLRQQALPAGLTMHCDYSHDGGNSRLKMHLSEEELSSIQNGTHRAKIVNAWRPLNTVVNAPLVISDRRSIRMDDLIEVDKVLPNMIEKAYYVKHRKHHRWYYMSYQTTEEVSVFTTWDSLRRTDNDIADWSPHGAASYFPDDTKPRESLEVRLIVLLPMNNVS